MYRCTARHLFVFLPSFVFIILGGRYIEQIQIYRFVHAFLSGVSVAVVEVIIVVSARSDPRRTGRLTQCRDHGAGLRGYYFHEGRRSQGGDRRGPLAGLVTPPGMRSGELERC